jgi:hypothetical protein
VSVLNGISTVRKSVADGTYTVALKMTGSRC